MPVLASARLRPVLTTGLLPNRASIDSNTAGRIWSRLPPLGNALFVPYVASWVTRFVRRCAAVVSVYTPLTAVPNTACNRLLLSALTVGWMCDAVAPPAATVTSAHTG